MAIVTLDVQTAPSAPSGAGTLYFDSTSKLLTMRNDTKLITPSGITNASVAAQAYTTAEIYLTGSALAIPSYLLQVGATFHWRIVATKTAGTAIPVFKVTIGTLGSVSDASLATFTGFAGPSSATDTVYVDIDVVIRTIGASATSEAGIRWSHFLAATGWANLMTGCERKDGTTFNASTAALIAGVTFNHSTAGAGNIEMVTSELVNN